MHMHRTCHSTRIVLVDLHVSHTESAGTVAVRLGDWETANQLFELLGLLDPDPEQPIECALNVVRFVLVILPALSQTVLLLCHISQPKAEWRRLVERCAQRTKISRSLVLLGCWLCERLSFGEVLNEVSKMAWRCQVLTLDGCDMNIRNLCRNVLRSKLIIKIVLVKIVCGWSRSRPWLCHLVIHWSLVLRHIQCCNFITERIRSIL